MAAPEPQALTLTCKNCSYNNEPERVYCHNCGEKLDRSVLPKEDQLRREPPERARKRIMRMTNPGGKPLKQALLTAVKTLAWAAVVAALILTVLPPDDVPPAKGELTMRMISSDLPALVRSPNPATITFKQADVNGFLKNARAKDASAIPGVEYKRTFMNLEPGIARITLERSFWGYPMYYGTIYRVEATNGVFINANLGGYVGRLAIPQFLMQWIEPVMLKDIRDTFKAELELVKQLADVKVEKGQVSLVSKGVQR